MSSACPGRPSGDRTGGREAKARRIDLRNPRRQDQQPPGLEPSVLGEEHNAYASKLLFAADALLLGRATYEGFVQAWPERSRDPYTDRINAMPKYVASRTLREAAWNSTILGSDVAAAVADVKAQHQARAS